VIAAVGEVESYRASNSSSSCRLRQPRICG